MYNTDRPIDNVKNDLLGRASFSKQLSKVLYYYSAKIYEEICKDRKNSKT